MRYLSLLLLLACPTGHTAAVICPDGITYTDSAVNTCPINSTNLSVLDIAQTTATISGTADAQAATAGTSYYWVSASAFPSGCTSLNYTYADLSSGVTATRQAAEKARQKCMNYKTMAAGTGAVAYGSATLSAAGVYTVPVTSLTAGTLSYVQHWVAGGAGGAGKIGKLSTLAFTTNASGGAPGESLVDDRGGDTSKPAPRFIGGGSDLNTGLSHAQRWASLNKVLCNFTGGTNIGLFNTTTFTASAANQLELCYDSMSTDWAIVGSYKLNGSSVPIWTVDGIRGATETDQKAQILGPLTQGCIDAITCDYSLAAFQAVGQSGGSYDPPVNITSNYVEFKNVDFDMQLSHSIIVQGTGNTTAADTGTGSTHHVILDGIDSKNNGGGVYLFLHGFTDGVIRNSTADTWGTCYQLRNSGLAQSKYEYHCPAGVVPSVGGLVYSYNGRLLVENNDWYKGIGEGGMDCGARTSHMIVRGNRLYGSSSVGQYADGCSWSIVENNIFIGGNDYGIAGAGNTGPGDGLSGAMAIDIESWQGSNADSTNNYVARNNLQVRPGYCVSFAINDVAGAAGKTVGMRLHGNTCIGGGNPSGSPAGVEFKQWTPIAADDVQVLDVKSNVFWNETASSCEMSAVTSVQSNHWYSARTGTCAGTGQTSGDPQLVTAYSSWASYKGPSSWPAFTDARPSPGSPLIDTGVSSEAVILTWADFGFAATEMADYKSGAISSTHWVKERYYDALNAVVGATPPKGAVCPAAGC